MSHCEYADGSVAGYRELVEPSFSIEVISNIRRDEAENTGQEASSRGYEIEVSKNKLFCADTPTITS